jgi:hypothetical protein
MADLDELRRLYEGGNLSALHEAANSCRKPGGEFVLVPSWVIEGLVEHNIEWMRELAPGKGDGRTARWAHQHQADLQHLIRYAEFIRARYRGLNKTEAYQEVARELKVEPDAVRKSVAVVLRGPKDRFYFGSPGWLDWKK